MRNNSISMIKGLGSVVIGTTLMAGFANTIVNAAEWQVIAGQESADRGSQALAFLPNELWIHPGDSIRWSFPTHERHTVSFLTSQEVRPPGFGPTFGIIAGCPGTTPDGSSFDGTACVTSDVFLPGETAGRGTAPLTYSVRFPTSGNFKFVCLVHNDMTGVVHVIDPATVLPHAQEFYDREAVVESATLLADASRLNGYAGLPEDNRTPNSEIAAGAGVIVSTTGAGSQTASLMRFLQPMIVVRVGDTVEWTSLDPSINHTVTFGTEPADPRLIFGNVQTTSDGARAAVISSATDSVSSGFLSPAPQDRPKLPQSDPGVTRFRVTFRVAGVFNYICAVHDQLGMKGTVVVH